MTTVRLRRRLGAIAALSALAIAATACAGDGSGGDSKSSVVLEFSTFAPEINPHGEVAAWFMDEVTKRTDGRVTFNVSWLESGCPAAEQYQCVTDGRSDIALGTPTFEPQKFPITLISAIPYLGESNDHKGRAFDSFYENDPALSAEYSDQDLEMLGLWTVRLVLGGKGDPFMNAADLAGKDIRTPGGPSAASLSLVGANPIAMTTNEVYEALQRGVVDGYSFPLEGIVSYSLSDHTEFIVDPLAGGNVAMTMVMNSGVYESLDDELRQVIDEVSSELNTRAAENMNSAIETACPTLVEESGLKEFVVWEEEVADEWSDKISDTLREDWETSAAENGVENPSAVFDSWKAALDAITDPVPDAELTCAELVAAAR